MQTLLLHQDDKLTICIDCSMYLLSLTLTAQTDIACIPKPQILNITKFVLHSCFWEWEMVAADMSGCL